MFFDFKNASSWAALAFPNQSLATISFALSAGGMTNIPLPYELKIEV